MILQRQQHEEISMPMMLPGMVMGSSPAINIPAYKQA